MENFVQGNLGIYYVLLMICIGLSLILTLKSKVRQHQTKVAKYYFIMTCIILLVTIFEFVLKISVKDLDVAMYTDPTTILIVAGLKALSKALTEIVGQYSIILLSIIGVGLFVKFLLKLQDMTNTLKLKNLKRNFIAKKVFDEKMIITDLGLLLRKVFQNISYTLIILYVIMPIFWHFELQLFYSSFVNLFLIIVFLEMFMSVNCGFALECEMQEDAGAQKLGSKIQNE